MLVWMRTKGEVEVIGRVRGAAGDGLPLPRRGPQGVCRQAPDLQEALQEVAEQGWSHVVVDGKLIRTDH
jgi:hypothetical protein